MPYAPHYRLTLSGTLGSAVPAVEQFSFGVSMCEGITDENSPGNIGGLLTLDQTQKDDLVADCTTFFADPLSKISSLAVLKQVKFAAIGADGKYVADPFIAEVNTAGGFTTNTSLAPQLAVCVSLRTARRGPSGKGRFYLPMPQADMGSSDLLITSASRANIQTAASNWITNLNNEPGLDVLQLGVVVASTKGYNTPVTGVVVGRAMDTIRSRRRSLTEMYGTPTPITLGQT